MRSEIILGDDLAQFVVDCKFAFKESTMQDQFILNLYRQLSRSSASAALNYAEGTGAGSDRDYANKLRIAYKEIREVMQTLKILIGLSTCPEQTASFDNLLRRADKLAGILYTCCRKAEAKFK
jgi:four helix bundle protein